MVAGLAEAPVMRQLVLVSAHLEAVLVVVRAAGSLPLMSKVLVGQVAWREFVRLAEALPEESLAAVPVILELQAISR